MTQTVKAKSLTPVQLKMLDIGAPVIVPCQTLAGDVVHVRLQTGKLEAPEGDAAGLGEDVPRRHDGGCWETHGVYVAVMPGGVDYGS